MGKYTAYDIANWILEYNEDLRNYSITDLDDISNLKLQKLLYYFQGIYLTTNREPLFDEKIYAWPHGPVIPEIYDKYKKYGASGIKEYEEIGELDKDTEELLRAIFKYFSKYSAWGLRELTHKETPWKETKQGEEITLEKIQAFFKKNYLFV